MGSIQPEPPLALLNQPVMTTRKIRMVCVGAGFAGLMMAHHVKHDNANDFIDLQIYEKNAGIGGTWFENRYPGAACDVPAHIYTFPFAPNPNWSTFYAPASEILQYMNDVSEKFGLDAYVKLNSRITSTIWSDELGTWSISVETKDPVTGAISTNVREAEILVNGSGILNRKKLPNIPGLETFRGRMVHSAAWDPNLTWDNKKVGIIGNGSSAIQILPQIQKTASHVVDYIRSPTWIIPEFLSDFTPDGINFDYTEQQKQTWREDPIALRDMRRKMEHAFNQYFAIFTQSSPQQAFVRDAFTKLMQARLSGNDALAEKLIPPFPVGCRRITPGTGYLEALQAENCEVNFNPIARITESGIVTTNEDGKETLEEMDIIVCATGFDVSFSPAWDIRGQQGADLAELWGKDAEAYLGIFAPRMPNYFIYNGPNCPIGHGSLMAVMDNTTLLIIRLARKLATQGYKAFTVKDQIIREYNDYAQEWLKTTVWASGCSSWYNRKSDGKVTAMYPGSILHYREMLENIRLEDFEWEAQEKNRFRFMGNGITKLEADGGILGDYLEM